MIIYRLWTDSNHKIQYTLGYFEDYDDAYQGLGNLELTASGPNAGIEEIYIIPSSKKSPADNKPTGD